MEKETTFPLSMKNQLLLYPFIRFLHLTLSQDINEIEMCMHVCHATLRVFFFSQKLFLDYS